MRVIFSFLRNVGNAVGWTVVVNDTRRQRSLHTCPLSLVPRHSDDDVVIIFRRRVTRARIYFNVVRATDETDKNDALYRNRFIRRFFTGPTAFCNINLFVGWPCRTWHPLLIATRHAKTDAGATDGKWFAHSLTWVSPGRIRAACYISLSRHHQCCSIARKRAQVGPWSSHNTHNIRKCNNIIIIFYATTTTRCQPVPKRIGIWFFFFFFMFSHRNTIFIPEWCVCVGKGLVGKTKFPPRPFLDTVPPRP